MLQVFKVDQKASWVGLGWELMAGGAITRTVRGSEDEGGRGYIRSVYYNEGDFDPAYSDNYYEMEEMLQGFIDTEPDIFYYNFMGYSGRFIFDHATDINSATISLIPHNDLKVIPLIVGNSFEGFKIITPDGFTAEFGYAEESQEYRPAGLIGDYTIRARSTWHLKEVTAPNGIDKVSFEYKTVSGGVLDPRVSQTDGITFFDPYSIKTLTAYSGHTFSQYLLYTLFKMTHSRLTSVAIDNRSKQRF